MRYKVVLIGIVVLLICAKAQAQVSYFPGGVSAPLTCDWTITVYGGVAPQTTNVACLANFSHIEYKAGNQGGTSTAVITPALPGTTPQVNVNCAQTSPNSTTVACVAPAGQSTITIYGFGW